MGFLPSAAEGDMEADFIPTYNDKSIYKSSDPNNTFWAKDQSRFGLKMLKNMGWSEGRGLGAKEDGATTHIAIKKKNTNAGIGETSASNDNWLKGAFEFNSLLKRLNNKPSGDAESEETQPKKKTTNNKSKRRHLYQNRLASRDASNYSQEDMALILGTQKMAASKEEEEEEVFSDSDDDSMMLTKQTVSVTDYFLRKGATKTMPSDEEDDADARPSFAAPSHDLTDFCGIGHKRKRESLPEEPEAPAVGTKKERREKKKKEKKEKKKKSKKKAKAAAVEEEVTKKSKKSKKEKKSSKKSKSEPEAKRRKKSKS